MWEKILKDKNLINVNKKKMLKLKKIKETSSNGTLLWPNNIRNSKHFICSCSVYLGKVLWQSRDTVNIDVTIVHYSCNITTIWTGAEVINHLKCKEWDKINNRLYFSQYLADCCSTKQWYQWIIVDLNLKQLFIPQSSSYSMMLHWRVTVN